MQTNNQTDKSKGWLLKTTLALALMMVSVANGWLLPAQAKLIEDLYSAEVRVPSQAGQQRQQAIREAFDQVVIKLTGQSELVDHSAIKQAKSQVNDYLVQYGYQNTEQRLTLKATFDGRKLRDLLADNELPYWGSRRPQLLLWIAREDEDGRRQLISSGDESIFSQQLRFLSVQNGVPLQWPLLDLTDNMIISSTDVWGRFLQPIRKASERYASDGVVVAKIASTENPEQPEKNWRLDWYVEVDSLRLSGEVFAESRDWLAEPFVTQIQQQLAKAYSVVRTEQQEIVTVPIIVQQLSDWRAVLDLENFLKSIASVQSVRLQQYSVEQSEFVIEVRGNADHLLQSIQLDGRLISQEVGPFVDPQQQQTATYQWNAE
ncbi:MAG: DUF2066 domain-containing protein [Pseudomonadota bacterium]